MSVDKFKFVSPGVFINEIDESLLEPLPPRMGPLIIGRFQKGPSARPVTVSSFREFISVFGNPAPGNPTGDIWRSGDMTAPTYAAYAAQAWLKNNSPATIYRVLGEERSDADTTVSTALAGWTTTNTFSTTGSLASVGGAYGMFIIPNPDSFSGGTAATASLIVMTNNPVVLDGDNKSFTLVSHDGTSKTYKFNNGGGTDNANEISTDVVRVNLANHTPSSGPQSGQVLPYANEHGLIAKRIQSAVTGSNGHGSKFAVAISTTNTTDDTLTITNAVAGTAGNKTIAAPVNGDAGHYTINGVITETSFGLGTGPDVTGTLAAVWYVDAGAMVLTGTARDGTQAQSAARFIKGTGQWTVKLLTGPSSVAKVATFNFDRDSDLFIRKVFNTNASETNSDITSPAAAYWLGETFESNLSDAENSQLKVTGSTPASTDQLGIILALDGTNAGSAIKWHVHKQPKISAQTGWFFSQDTRGVNNADFNPTNGDHVETLFKFHALDSGEHANRDIKISIADIKLPTDNFNAYGTFSIVIRNGTDNDTLPVVLERYSNVNLDPTSTNYIERVIGDRSYDYDSTNKIITEIGNYPNRSKFVRVQTSTKVQKGAARAGWLPFGVYGPYVPITKEWLSGSKTSDTAMDNAWYVGAGSSAPCLASGALPSQLGGIEGTANMYLVSNTFQASIEFPKTRLRATSSDGGLVQGSKAYFGYQANIRNSRRFDHTNIDLLRGRPSAGGASSTGEATDTDGNVINQYSWVFTLDDVKEAPDDSTHAVWASGSRAAGTSYTAVSASDGKSTNEVLLAGYSKFTSPMFGGFDGFDITEADPLRNKYISKNGPTEKKNYAYHSLKKAVDIIADKEFIEFDVAAMPGITNSSLNQNLINACEDRADALAIVDLYGNFEPKHEDTREETSRLGSVTDVVNTVKDLNTNSSYGCSFYPFVQIRDTISDSILYVPPSVVALGTFSSSQRKSAVWFAPAGFTRGGLSEGSAGLPVVGVRKRLTSDDRDKLYDANINPIATFPAEGIVIFGQKTLQMTPSALDRINVRRLLIFVKKEISRFAATTLFEQNVQATWDRFKGKVVPFLEKVQAGFGLTDFRVVLDETTTTPDLVDRNILYAKIFLKPARAIEFIALDFIITKSGASFDD